MPRRAGGNGREVFRVLVTRPRFDGNTATEIFGPYATAGAAKAVLTSETHDWRGEPLTGRTGHIERATTEWKKVLAP